MFRPYSILSREKRYHRSVVDLHPWEDQPVVMGYNVTDGTHMKKSVVGDFFLCWSGDPGLNETTQFFKEKGQANTSQLQKVLSIKGDWKKP